MVVRSLVRWLVRTSLLGALLATGAAPIAAAPLGFDASFGSNGKVFANVARAPSDDDAAAVVVQPDGKTVTAGTCKAGAFYAYCIARYDSSGAPDPSFGRRGLVVTPLGPGDANARAVVLSGTKIVVAGSCGAGANTDFCVVRYLADGSLDPSFNGTGVVVTPMGTGTDDAWALAMDGTSILVAGECQGGGGTQFCLARYLANGVLDPNYGNGGKVFAGFGIDSPSHGARALLLSEGKALVAGACLIYTVRNMCVARFNANGALDTGFGGNGVAASEMGLMGTFSLSTANALALSGSRILLVGGCSNGTNLDFCMLRVNALGGDIDFTLAGTGYVKVPIGSGHDVPTGVALLGSVTAISGHCDVGGARRFCLTVLAESGVVYANFNGGSSLVDSFGSTDNFAHGLAVNNGLITLAGTCGAGTARDFCVARYAGDGPRDLTFNGTGRQIHDLAVTPGADQLASLLRQPDGKLLASGYCGLYPQSGALCLARFNTDGSFDTTFGEYGTVAAPTMPLDFHTAHAALDSQNRPVLAGACNGGTSICAFRYLPDGSPDTSFGVQGRATIAMAPNVYANIVGVAAQADGSIVAGASCYFGATGRYDFCWFKLTAGGSLDTGFGNTGTRLAGVPFSFLGAFGFAADTSGTLIAGSCGSTFDNQSRFCVARVTAAGHLDTAFGGGAGHVAHNMGSGESYAYAVTLQNGNTLLGGLCTVNGSQQMCLARLLPDGSLDTTFSADGKAAHLPGPYPAEVRALLPDGSGVVAAGSCAAIPNGGDFDLCLARFMADGSLDTTFNDTGSLIHAMGTYTSRAVALVRDGNRIVAGVECAGPSGADFCLAAFALLSNDLPRAPAVTTVSAGDAQVSVAFTPPSDDGASPITQYTATCGAQSASGPASPLTVANLANGVAVACTVTATNGSGTGPSSDPPAIATPRKVATVTLTTSGASTTPGVNFTLTATVAGQAPGGSVEFRANGSPVPGCGGTMTGNVATCITTQIPVGNYVLTVHYPGDVANTAADSAPVALTVVAGAVNLTYAAAGSGNGTATSNPAGLLCNASCVTAFALGTQVTIVITIPPGSTLVTVAGCDAKPQPHVCVLTMNAARTVTAFFQAETNPLNVSKSGAGAGSVASNPAGIDCGATCTANFDYGTVVTLTPTPNAGSVFTGWGGVCSGSGACQVTVDQMKFVTASFGLQTPPKLAVSQSAAPSVPKAGKDIVYAVSVSNTSADTVSGVTLTDTIAAGMQFIWASPGCVRAGPTVTCSLGALGAGASALVNVVLRPASPGSYTHEVSASGTDAGPNVISSVNTPVAASPTATLALRYRLYSPVTLEHHFTTDLNEYNVLGSYVGTWIQEGTVGKVLDNPGSYNGVGAVPYYRLYDSATRWHHWTTDANEYYTLVQFPNWSGEGVDGYILPTDTTGATQLYRLTYPFVPGLHHWTIDTNEYNTLVTPAYGWIGEGGSGFVIQ